MVKILIFYLPMFERHRVNRHRVDPISSRPPNCTRLRQRQRPQRLIISINDTTPFPSAGRRHSLVSVIELVLIIIRLAVHPDLLLRLLMLLHHRLRLALHYLDRVVARPAGATHLNQTQLSASSSTTTCCCCCHSRGCSHGAGCSCSFDAKSQEGWSRRAAELVVDAVALFFHHLGIHVLQRLACRDEVACGFVVRYGSNEESWEEQKM